MVLNNLSIAGADETVSIRTSGNMIAGMSAQMLAPVTEDVVVNFEDAIVFPGIINSHDHLDFNLFPQLGAGHFNNYREWAKHLHQHYKNEINAVLKVPKVLRYEWGVFKNLLCGVTAVVNHGEHSGLKNELITIYEEGQSLHSVGFEKGWKLKLNNPLSRRQPVNIHIGEGDDLISFSEIEAVTGWNLFKRDLIGVHAVSMTEKHAEKFKAVVWCPATNYFMLNKTALVNVLQNHTKILFGTDSTLTASWDIWAHLRQARNTMQLTDEGLYRTLNKNAASTWGLNNGELKLGKDADLVIARRKTGTRGYNSFFSVTPADILMVVHQGNIRLVDESLISVMPERYTNEFSQIFIGDAGKYVQGDLPALMEQIREYYPAANFPVTASQAVVS